MLTALKERYPNLEKSYNFSNTRAIQSAIQKIDTENPNFLKLVLENSVLQKDPNEVEIFNSKV
jgi:hypothetical protein